MVLDMECVDNSSREEKWKVEGGCRMNAEMELLLLSGKRNWRGDCFLFFGFFSRKEAKMPVAFESEHDENLWIESDL